jgi:superfamily I DNA/RNA helicase
MSQPNHQWSEQQQAIFHWFKKTKKRGAKKNLVVRARAGTGKTTTILEGISHAPEDSILLVAFNKSIASELETKLKNDNAEAKTLHALGFSFVRRNWQVRVDADRGFNLAQRVAGKQASKHVVKSIAKLASLAKNAAPDLDLEDVLDLAIEHNVTPDDSNWSDNQIARAAIDSANLALLEDGTIDFDDMLFVPVRLKWIHAKWDLVVVDEAQDMNPTQLILARGACKKKGRMVVVGDDRQAIYGFRGADITALDRLKNELQAIEMGLTITYRCPKLIVDYAKTLVPDYSAADTAPDGIIDGISYLDLANTVTVGDFVLSRTNAPLAGACLSILRAGKAAKISGKDIAKTLLNLIDKWKDRGIKNLLERLTIWEKNEIEKAATYPERRRDVRQALVIDQAETLRVLSEGCAQVAELRLRVENMFVDEKANPLGVVLCSSIHKAKGQERERVFLFSETLYPGGRHGIEEKNLEYVGVTRAKKHLTWIDGSRTTEEMDDETEKTEN